jgi:hypothetical protein
VASLQARSALRSTHPLLVFYKLISIAASILLLVAGWVALCFIKDQFTGRETPPQQQRAAAPLTRTGSAAGPNDAGQAQVKRLSKPVKLVYSCATDHEFYHTSTHIPRQCERTALSEEAASERNLKPCKTCMTE